MSSERRFCERWGVYEIIIKNGRVDLRKCEKKTKKRQEVDKENYIKEINQMDLCEWLSLGEADWLMTNCVAVCLVNQAHFVTDSNQERYFDLCTPQRPKRTANLLSSVAFLFSTYSVTCPRLMMVSTSQ